MSVHEANQTGFSTSIAGLHCPEQLIIWAIRHWLDGSHNWPAIQNMFWQECGITNVEAALQGFQDMVEILSTSSRRTLFFHRPNCRYVSADELSIIGLISALQANRNEHAEAFVCWLVPRSNGGKLLQSVAGFASALRQSGHLVSQKCDGPLQALAPVGRA